MVLFPGRAARGSSSCRVCDGGSASARGAGWLIAWSHSETATPSRPTRRNGPRQRQPLRRAQHPAAPGNRDRTELVGWGSRVSFVLEGAGHPFVLSKFRASVSCEVRRPGNCSQPVSRSSRRRRDRHAAGRNPSLVVCRQRKALATSGYPLGRVMSPIQDWRHNELKRRRNCGLEAPRSAVSFAMRPEFGPQYP